MMDDPKEDLMEIMALALKIDKVLECPREPLYIAPGYDNSGRTKPL